MKCTFLQKSYVILRQKKNFFFTEILISMNFLAFKLQEKPGESFGKRLADCYFPEVALVDSWLSARSKAINGWSDLGACICTPNLCSVPVKQQAQPTVIRPVEHQARIRTLNGIQMSNQHRHQARMLTLIKK